MNKLDEICGVKRQEVDRLKATVSIHELEQQAHTQTPARGFEMALRAAARDGFALIAEIKKASPSKGLIRAEFDPATLAQAYQAGGATCLSVLTDEQFFQGHADYLRAARAGCDLPVLRKDFMIDPWQVLEARAMGADAVLVIVAALDDSAMLEIEAAAFDNQMDVLVEVHDEAELDRALQLRSRLIGFNNRDLRTFATDLTISEQLARYAPEGALLVGESGISSHDDCLQLARNGIRCFLVGESLMRQADVETATRNLLNG